MHIQCKKLCLGVLLCIMANVSYAHVGYKQAQPSQNQGVIKVVALKRAEAPFLMTTLGHRMHKTYSMVNRYSYVSVNNTYSNIYPEASARVNTVRPFINYQGSRAY